MQRFSVAIVVFACAGCRFSVDALHDVTPAPTADLASPAMPADLGAPMLDSAVVVAGDLANAPPPADLALVQDLLPDPCGTASALGNGNVAAQCVVGSPPTVDGNLADWPSSLFTAMTRSTAGVLASGSWQNDPGQDDPDLSARFAVRWDLTYVYVAVAITDDIRNTPNASSLTQNDAAELFFDGLHNRTQAYGKDDWQLIYSADQQKEAAADGALISWPSGTVEKWGGTSPHWTLEAAVPWSLLGNAPVTAGRVIGFDLKLDDNDGGATRARDLAMYYTAGPGGMCTAPYCRTDAFGAVQLMGR